MYKWNNENKLQTLKVSGENDVLVFETGDEKAKVYIQNNDIAKVVCSYNGKETVINKSERAHLVPGEGNTQRDVYHYLKPGGPLPTLRLGITKHRGTGTWSSLPHQFELETEPGFEEVFFHLLQGKPERAIQLGRGVWADNSPVDEAWFVYDRSWSTIPMGYHPVVGEPGVEVSYIWAYLAKKPKWEKVQKSWYANEFKNK